MAEATPHCARCDVRRETLCIVIEIDEVCGRDLRWILLSLVHRTLVAFEDFRLEKRPMVLKFGTNPYSVQAKFYVPFSIAFTLGIELQSLQRN